MTYRPIGPNWSVSYILPPEKVLQFTSLKISSQLHEQFNDKNCGEENRGEQSGINFKIIKLYYCSETIYFVVTYRPNRLWTGQQLGRLKEVLLIAHGKYGGPREISVSTPPPFVGV